MYRLKSLFAFLLSCSLLSASAQREWSYDFRMDTSGAAPALEVTLRFRGSATGKTELLLPDAWGSEHELYRAVSALGVEGKGARLLPGRDSLHRLLVHRPGAALTVHYRLQQDWTGAFEQPKHFRAVLQRDWMHLSGYALFVKPDNSKEDTVDLRMSWSGLPAAWAVANSFHTGSRSWRGRVCIGDLENSFFMAGDFRLQQVEADGRPLHFAIRGQWSFPDTALVQRAVQIIRAQRAFWKDSGEPYYLVAAAPLGGQATITGNSMYQSFLIDMSADTKVDRSLMSILSHEYFHRWVGIGMVLAGHENDQKWFSEGFTEYYTYKMLWHSGILDTATYVAELNRVLHAYYTSPVAREPQSFLRDHYWDNSYTQKLPYNQGAAFALWLDGRISAASNGRRSLDDLLFALRDARGRGAVINDSLLLQTAATMGVPEATSLYQEAIVKGGLVPVAANPVLQGYRVANTLFYPFALGFQSASLRRGGRVEGVPEHGASFRAGLRNGMVLQGWSFSNSDVSRPVTLKVEDGNGGLRTISYLPKSEEGIPVPQLVKDAGQ